MGTVIARRVASTPVRTPAETWARISELLAPDAASSARTELAKASGIACASISSEANRDAPIVVWGGGPRVRVYCVFNDDAITSENVNEEALPRSPTEGDWKLSIPCLPEDVAWCNRSLSAVTRRITARSMEDDVELDSPANAISGGEVSINAKEFLQS